MRLRYLWLVLPLAAVVLAAGVSPLMAWDYKGYVSPETGKKSFKVYACTDTDMYLAFTWDAPCKLMVQSLDSTGKVLISGNLNDGAYLRHKGGGTFTVYIWSEGGSCNWEATMADIAVPGVCDIGPYTGKAGGPDGEGTTKGDTATPGRGTTKPAGGSGGSVTDLDGESPKGTADCAGMIWDRVTMDKPAGMTLYAKIDENCVPGMVCFTVGPGLYAEIKSSYFKSNGYNCATGAYIEDPGFVVVEDCCSEKVLFTRDYDKKGNAHDTGRYQFFGPGKFTLQPSGGRNLMLKVEFNVYQQ